MMQNCSNSGGDTGDKQEAVKAAYLKIDEDYLRPVMPLMSIITFNGFSVFNV